MSTISTELKQNPGSQVILKMSRIKSKISKHIRSKNVSYIGKHTRETPLHKGSNHEEDITILIVCALENRAK